MCYYNYYDYTMQLVEDNFCLVFINLLVFKY